MRRKIVRAHPGAHDEYHVGAVRHSDVGFNVTIVSSIESGAGSVGVSARPVLPSTRSTSGTCLMMRSLDRSSFSAFAIEMPGIVEGI